MNHPQKCIQLNYLAGKTMLLMILTLYGVKFMQLIHFTCLFSNVLSFFFFFLVLLLLFLYLHLGKSIVYYLIKLN